MFDAPDSAHDAKGTPIRERAPTVDSKVGAYCNDGVASERRTRSALSCVNLSICVRPYRSPAALMRWSFDAELREQVMFIFSVRDMRVSSQAAAVLEAVNHVDVNATVSIDLLANEVQIVQASASATELSDAIAHAGFDPVLRDCGHTVRGPWQIPPKIPFEGFAHDFGASAEIRDERGHISIAGPARLNSLLPAEALGPPARSAHSPVAAVRIPEEN